MNSTPIRVSIVHQIDPGGPVTGGIDSIIRGIARWAPADIEVRIVGLTTDTQARPIGTWTDVDLGGPGPTPFLAVGRDPSSMVRKGLPLSVRLAWGVARHRRQIEQASDVLEFHRMESGLVLAGSPQGKNTIVHQHMKVLTHQKADIRWRWFPWLYYRLERAFLHRMDSVFCVSSAACADYQTLYPDIENRFRFLPTWMDTDRFCLDRLPDRRQAKDWLAQTLGVSTEASVLIAVGRLDHQKNPLLLVDAFARVAAARPDATLVLVGAGVLREAVVGRVRSLGLEGRVILAGLRPPAEVARMLAAADLYVMSSAYEGMPISVLEAMACGLPVVSTRVGEVERMVRPGVNGALVEVHEPQPLADAVLDVLSQPRERLSAAAAAAVSAFVPSVVLAPVFDAYRHAARHGAIAEW